MTETSRGDIAEEITEAAREWSSVDHDPNSDEPVRSAQALSERTGVSGRTAARLVGHLGGDDPEKLDAAAQLTKRPR